ncbi:MAG: phenylalanine--tRNA ligase subunit alpha [Planctomycetota bacterium]
MTGDPAAVPAADIARVREEAVAALRAAGDADSLEKARACFLGRKGGIRRLLESIPTLPEAERRDFGKSANALKIELEGLFQARQAELGAATPAAPAGPRPDITLPGKAQTIGHRHVLTRVIGELADLFATMGFEHVEGPEVELEHYNFKALNIPMDHPAQDPWNTFYVAPGEGLPPASVGNLGRMLLRSHTSTVQIRAMEMRKPPLRIIASGKVFRPDTVDATHMYLFHQMEGLLVEESVSFGDLKGVLALFAERYFGEGTKTRFRPSFFPFTEPSAEVDISCIFCANRRGAIGAAGSRNRNLPPNSTTPVTGETPGNRCSVCGGSGWIEILGAGMVHPNVFRSVGYDPAKWRGFAFGMGIERIAMLRYGINDIRLFTENDVGFLKQF